MRKAGARMLKAISLIRAGMTVPNAARVAQISHPAIYMSPLYAQVCEERLAAGLKVRRAAHRTRP